MCMEFDFKDAGVGIKCSKSECLARTLQAVSKPLVNWVLGAGLKLRHD